VDNKAYIRSKISNTRNSLSEAQVIAKSNKIENIVISTLLPSIKDLDKKNVALYFSANNEVRVTQIIQYLSQLNIDTSLPKINPQSDIMDFKLHKKGGILNPNQKYKNILEPSVNNIDTSPEIIFLPLVACDKNGNRIGMGGGFYDRKIAKMKEGDQNITLIGLAYNFQIVDDIKFEKFDQCLDYIVSEDEITKCTKR
jgi:5-formyltetrahydrofolate cyclo-ligase